MKKRNINCDILRIIAFSLVVSVHYLLYNDFYNTLTFGKTMYGLYILRTLFIVCVPLFIILSGYLMNKKELNKQYYKNLFRIILTYILCSIACIISIHFILNRDLLSLKEYIFQLFNFSGAPYSWYVNMYIGLYLMIPFLNILWNNLKNKEYKKYLIITLFAIMIFPTFINIYNFTEPNWFLNPVSSRTYQVLIPDFWTGVGYPILYYFVGCYLKEYPIKLSFIKNLLIILCLMILFGSFNYYRNYNALYDYGIYSGYYSFEAFFISLFLSNLILNLKINIKNERLIKFISKVSYLTFGAYLLSAIFDNLFYKLLLVNKTSINGGIIYMIPIIIIIIGIIYMIPIIIIIIVLSLISSYIVDLIEKGIKYSFKIIKNRKV